MGSAGFRRSAPDPGRARPDKVAPSPQAMSDRPPGLDDLRHAIDKCDEAILDLLTKRNALSRSVGLGKALTGAAIWRPAREARILRRLLGRFDDPHEKDRIH